MKALTVVIVGGFVLIGVATGADAQSKCTGGEGESRRQEGVVQARRLREGAIGEAAARHGEAHRLRGKVHGRLLEGGIRRRLLAPTGDQGAIEGKVDTFVTNEDASLTNGHTNTLPSRCISSLDPPRSGAPVPETAKRLCSPSVAAGSCRWLSRSGRGSSQPSWPCAAIGGDEPGRRPPQERPARLA
jgi:hypothetical protein